MKKQSVVKKFLYSQKVAPYVFVMPFILTFAIFFAYSIVSMILMSFQKVAGANTTFIKKPTRFPNTRIFIFRTTISNIDKNNITAINAVEMTIGCNR